MLFFVCGLTMLATTDAKKALKGTSLRLLFLISTDFVFYSYRLINRSLVLKIIIFSSRIKSVPPVLIS